MPAPPPDERSHRRVVLFARAPHQGRVKTRLAATVGDEQALAIYVALATQVTAAMVGGPWQLRVRCAPDDAVPEVARWLAMPGRVEPQGPGDLGARMCRAMDDGFAQGVQASLIIGTDCPDVDAALVEMAFAALDRADVVFGPALDGGYYLVGARRSVPAIFSEVPWSADDTLAVSLERAAQAGYSVELLEPRADIDTEADWLAWRARASRPAT